MRLLRRLLRELNSKYSPEESEVFRINDKYFTLSPSLRDGLKARKGLVYAGRYLGRDRRLFQPSAPLLEALVGESGTHKVQVRRDAGRYLGRDRRLFQPSAQLLEALVEESGTHKVQVRRGAAWLFACGRDLFEESVEEAEPELTLGAHYLVVYGGRCVGYGRYETAGDRRVIRNLFDIGDFLRREA